MFTFLDSSWYELSSFTLSTSSCKVMILLFATASCGDKNQQRVLQIKNGSCCAEEQKERTRVCAEWNALVKVQLWMTHLFCQLCVGLFQSVHLGLQVIYWSTTNRQKDHISHQLNNAGQGEERHRLWQTLNVCSAPPHNFSDRELLWFDRHWKSRERGRQWDNASIEEKTL